MYWKGIVVREQALAHTASLPKCLQLSELNKVKPGTAISILVSQAGGRDLNTWASHHTHTQSVSAGSWVSSKDRTPPQDVGVSSLNPLYNTSSQNWSFCSMAPNIPYNPASSSTMFSPWAPTVGSTQIFPSRHLCHTDREEIKHEKTSLLDQE